MNPLTSEWVEKAEGDFATAARELRVRKAPNYDAVCFHAQQCAEKYLKAVLQEAGIPFPKTHNLAALLDMAKTVQPAWEMLRPSLLDLATHSVNVRYPGETADKPTARAARDAARHVRSLVRAHLGLEP